MKRSFLLLLPVLLGTACGGADAPEAPSTSTLSQPAVKVLFAGRVLDNRRVPIANARVSVNGSLTLTDAQGAYKSAVDESRAGYVLDIRKDGYAPANVFKTAGASGLSHVLAKGFTTVINPAAQNVLVDPASGIQVILPANSLQRGTTGTPAAGSVTFSIVPHGPDTMPGDFSARNASNQAVALETVGAVTLAAVDENGNTLTLLAGRFADVRLPVPAAVGASMPACVLNGSCRAAMWRFEPGTGLWREQSASAVFSPTGTSFRITGQRSGEMDPANGLGTWNADIEVRNPACTLIEFTNVPPECAGFELAFEQLDLSGTPRSKDVTVSSAAQFVALVNLRANAALDISVEFPAGAPAYCATNLSLTSTPGASAGFPLYWATGGRTSFITGTATYTGYPKNSAGSPITLADVVAGDHPCGSHVVVQTNP